MTSSRRRLRRQIRSSSRLVWPGDADDGFVAAVTARCLGRRRLVIRRGRLGVTYSSRVIPTVVTLIGAGGVLALGTLINATVVTAALAGVIVSAWIVITLRQLYGMPIPQRGGGGPGSPPDAGVREPRRPLPLAPAGAVALPLPDDGPPRRIHT